MEQEQAFADSLNALSKFFVGDKTLQQTLDRVTEVSTVALPKAEFVGITMMANGRPQTTLFTDPSSPEIDQAQYDAGSATMLAQLAQELSAASTVEQVAQMVTTTGRDVLDAAFVNIAVVDADHRHLDLVHSPPLPPDMASKYVRLALSDDVPLTDAVTRAETIFVPDLDTLTRQYPHLVDDTTSVGLQATASIPLFRADRTIAGAIGVAWNGPVEFTPIVRSGLTTVSEMCAQALDRSQIGDARTQFVRSLQFALLSSTGLRDGLDIAAEYIAANNALGFGGDWYDFVHISPTRTALVVGDICGHGIEAAARMTQIRGTINALVSLHSNNQAENASQRPLWGR